jgi:hypothetical protein
MSGFAPGLPHFEATARFGLRALAQLLQLPDGVDIVGVRPDPNDAHSVILDLVGALPAGGELQVEYDTIRAVRLRGMRQVAP